MGKTPEQNLQRARARMRNAIARAIGTDELFLQNRIVDAALVAVVRDMYQHYAGAETGSSEGTAAVFDYANSLGIDPSETEIDPA